MDLPVAPRTSSDPPDGATQGHCECWRLRVVPGWRDLRCIPYFWNAPLPFLEFNDLLDDSKTGLYLSSTDRPGVAAERRRLGREGSTRGRQHGYTRDFEGKWQCSRSLDA